MCNSFDVLQSADKTMTNFDSLWSTSLALFQMLASDVSKVAIEITVEVILMAIRTGTR